MNQKAFQRAALGASQCDLILRCLRKHLGCWVSLPTLWQASGSMAVHSRITDLRKRGAQIEQASLRRGRQCLSLYRLVSDAPLT